MRVLQSDNVICVDVDDTLVSWQHIGFDLNLFAHDMEPEVSPAECPRDSTSFVDITLEGQTRRYCVFGHNVESLKTHYHKGHTVVVWSGSGVEWAEAVVRALELEPFVDLVMCKPRWLLDDMRPAEFMPVPYWGYGDPGKAKLK